MAWRACLALALAAAAATAHGARVQTLPNIVLFLIDDLGYGDLGCYGNRTSRTPNVDFLAQNGVRFTQWISGSNICTPSRTALLTGRYAARSGMESDRESFRTLNAAGQPGGLPQSEVTIAELLHEAGYATGIVGKWHLGINSDEGGLSQDGAHLPTRHGFDFFYGMPTTNVQTCGHRNQFRDRHIALFILRSYGAPFIAALLATVLAHAIGFTRRRALLGLLAAQACVFALVVHYVATYTLLSPLSCILMRGEAVVEQPVLLEQLQPRLVREAKRFIDSSRGGPFFLYFADVKVHTALFTAPEFRGRSGHGEFVDNVEEMDWGVGEVLAHVRALGLEDDTLFLFTSDNGPFLEEGHEAGTSGFVADARGQLAPLRAGKGTNFEGGVRIPGIAYWKGRVPPRVSGQLVSSLDLLPTLAALAGAPLPHDRILDGVDLAPLLWREPRELARDAHDFFFHYCGTRVTAVRHGSLKLHLATASHESNTSWAGCAECCPGNVICSCAAVWHDPPLLFDLAHDPGERRPLPVASHAAAVDAMRAALERHRRTFERPADGGGVRSQLEGLSRPWLQPCCEPPRCVCCKECNTSEAEAHRREWGHLA